MSLLLTLATLTGCSAAPDDDLAQHDSEVRSAPCTPAFEEEVEPLLTLRKWDYSERDVAVRDFLWAIGLGERPDPNTSFVYVSPEGDAHVQATAKTLKALLTGRYTGLSPLVDSLSEKIATRNLHGAPASTLATSFHCLGSPAQSVALSDPSLDFEEKPIKPTAKMREHFLRDGDDASGAWSDTVLEGPYELLDGYAITIESVDEIRLSNKRVALRVTIGAPAVATESCEQAEDESWPEECSRGAIAQTLYYDAELHRIEAMEEGAEFVEQ